MFIIFCISYIAFLTFLRDRFFSNFLQNPSAVLCQSSTSYVPRRGHFDLYVHVILVIGGDLQTTGTRPHVGFTWNGNCMMKRSTWNVIHILYWHISYAYWSCRCCCCCTLIRLTVPLSNCANLPALMNTFFYYFTCSVFASLKILQLYFYVLWNFFVIVHNQVMNLGTIYTHLEALSTAPSHHMRIDESCIHKLLVFSQHLKMFKLATVADSNMYTFIIHFCKTLLFGEDFLRTKNSSLLSIHLHSSWHSAMVFLTKSYFHNYFLP